MSANYSAQHLRETAEVVAKIDPALCERAVDILAQVRERGGRLFILGVGGSAVRVIVLLVPISGRLDPSAH